MIMKTHELKGFTLTLSQVVFVSPVFEAEANKGFQFNVRVVGDRLQFNFPVRTDAVMARELLVKAIKEA